MREVLEIDSKWKAATLFYKNEKTYDSLCSCVGKCHKVIEDHGNVIQVRFRFQDEKEFEVFINKADSIDGLWVKPI